MKKLALALMCLVSVAFFASCDKDPIIPIDPVITHPEPSIAIIAEEGYLYDGQVIEANQVYPYGFRAASNDSTKKELSSLIITCNGEILCDTAISGTEFVYRGEISFVPNNERDIIGSAEFVATVTDVDGKINQASFTVEVNLDDSLEVTDLEWTRKATTLEGDTEAEMAALGLKWTGSHKEVFATIEPLNDNCKMWVRPGDEFATVNTETELAAYFANLIENQPFTSQSYRNITTSHSDDYNDVLAVITEDGFQYLIHITHADIQTGSYGTQITITGQFK